MRKRTYQRRKYFVDPAVQGAVVRQAVYYWLCGSIVFLLFISLYRLIPNALINGWDGQQVWYHLGPLAISSAVFLPFVLYRAIRFSHRFVGPMVRFRQVLDQLANGEPVPPIKLRDNDYWKDFAQQLNEVSARLAERQPLNQTETKPEPEPALAEC